MRLVLLTAAAGVGVLLAGCVAAEDEPRPPRAAVLPDDLAMEGADVVSFDGAHVTWRWEAALGPGARLPNGVAHGDAVEAAFDVPAGVHVRLDAALSWEEDGGRTLRRLVLVDETGDVVCENQQAVLVTGVEPPPITCAAPVPARPDASAWRVRVEPRGNVEEAAPFALELTMTALIPDALAPPAAVAHRAGGLPAEAPGAPPRVETFDTGTRAFEPTLGVHADGTLFYQGFPGDACSMLMPVMRSRDGGASWEDVAPRVGDARRHPCSWDPYLHVDRDTGRVFTLDYPTPPSVCHALSFSDDQGESWSTTLACGHADFQKLWTGPPAVSTPRGYPNVVYVCSLNVGFGGPYNFATTCSKSLDGGLTFAATGEPPFVNNPAADSLGPVPGRCFGGAMPGAVAPDGTLFIATGWCDKPHVAMSRDEGATWTRVQVSDIGVARSRVPSPDPLVPVSREEYAMGLFATAVAVDAAGVVYVAWIGEDRLPYLAHSTDGGATWSEAAMIAAPGLTETNHAAIDAGAPGHVVVAYMGSADSTFPEHGMDDTPYENVTWTGYLTVTADATAPDPVFLTAPVRPVEAPLLIGECGVGRCGAAGDFFDVEIAPDGTPWAAFVDVAGRGEGEAMGIVSRMVLDLAPAGGA